MLEQEGAKPHTAADQPAIPDATLSYGERLLDLIGTLQAQKLRGDRPDLAGAISHLDAAENNAPLKDWLAANGLLTKPAFDKALAGVERRRRTEAALGFIPQDALDLVRRYAERSRITLDARGTIKRARSYDVGGQAVDASNRDTSRDTRLIFDVVNAEGDNLDSYGRELRLLSDKLDLGFRDSVIGDAIQAWQEETTRRIKVDAMLAVQFIKGRATGPDGMAMWEAVERACFDTTDTRPGFAVAVLQKFIWQVKRKARALPVTNHLMPVLTGAQGKGKTEFVKAMTRPLRDLMREVDFGLITDGKTADIWSSLILFIDEMGHFNRTDVDTVKNVITSTERSIRTMRSNHSAPVRNQATLIGCTNKSLGQLIRDDTGGRRFAELVWRNDPDWEASNAVDWKLLWQSVDEEGADPLVAANMMECLRGQQEDNRNQHPVEVWARGNGHSLGTWAKAADLHAGYREWEKDAFPRHDTSQSMFGRTLSQLIQTYPDLELEKRQDRSGVAYRRRQTGGAA